MMNTYDLDRSQDVDQDTSLDVSRDINHDFNDYELSHDDDLAIERHRFLKSFNRNKFARGANKEKVDDLNVQNEDSFHYDGKVLDFTIEN